jgi:hypothetical protein
VHSMFQTNSDAPSEPGVGEWKLVEDPDKDATLREIEEYCNFRGLFNWYHFFLLNRLSVASVDTRPPTMCQDVLNALADMVEKIPGEPSQVSMLLVSDCAGCGRASLLKT